MKKTKIALLALSLFAGSAMADDASLKSSLEKIGATNVRLSESPLPGFRLATSNEGIVHISENGQYVVQGNFNVLELKNGKATDITHKTQMASLNALSNEMIIYPAKQEKHVVTVFMDITCHYCHILFENVKAYNEEGITLRFLAFPRAGLNSQTAKQMEARSIYSTRQLGKKQRVGRKTLKEEKHTATQKSDSKRDTNKDLSSFGNSIQLWIS